MVTENTDDEIIKNLPLLTEEFKKYILAIIKSSLYPENTQTTSIDYFKYQYPVNEIKFSRD